MKSFFVSLKAFSVCVCCILIGMQVVHAESKGWAPNSAEGTVKRLYHDYAWVVLGSELGGTDLEAQSIKELERYFENSLAELFKKDMDCVERTHDGCKLNFSAIYASQDPAAYELKVSEKNAKDEVIVQFKYPSNQELVVLTYKMVNTPKGWRIRDIAYKDYKSTLRQMLE